MTKRPLVATVLVCVTVSLIVGCGDEEDEPTRQQRNVQSPPGGLTSSIPEPDQQQAQQLRDELAGISPGLDNGDSIDNARNTCSSLLSEIKTEDLIENTQIRFEGDGINSMSPKQAKQVIDLVRGSVWCE